MQHVLVGFGEWKFLRKGVCILCLWKRAPILLWELG
jgi:hypothetical protein